MSKRDDVRTEVIATEAQWDRLAPDWSALFDVSPQASPPLSFSWLRHWWRVFGASYGGGLRIVTMRRGAELIGVLPLYSSGKGVRRLRFISTGEGEHEEICPDYMDLLCAPGQEQACRAAAWHAVAGMSWDCLELLDIAEGSLLLSQAPGHGNIVARGACPIAELEGGFEAYLRRLSSNGRQQARRLLREAEKEGVVLEVADASRVGACFEDLVSLHQQRWVASGKPGCFAAPRFTEFHRTLAREWVPSGRAVLARASLAGTPIAALYGFVTGSKFDFYQSGVRTDGPLRSPGNLAHLMLMRELAGRGVTRYDFLRGSSSYKERLATTETKLYAIQVWRPTIRSAIYRSSRRIGRGIRNALRRPAIQRGEPA